MTWYPDGSGPQPEPETGHGDDDPTISQQTRVHQPNPLQAGDDDPTVAHAKLERDIDDDPTLTHKALNREQPRNELLDQRYQLVAQIGSGGMGEVWQARHVQLARDVAIKFLSNEEGGPRFKLEAQAIAAVRHTGVVDVLDFGETKQGVPYFVMELIEGETLSSRVRNTGALSWALVRNIALEVADALAHAHEAGVVHRDLKPSNVIVLDAPPQRGSSTKLIDFGIAKLLDSSEPKLTQEGYVQGTPAYMSPEQVLGEDVDARTDVYGLGCLLYFLLSGRRPFPDKSGTAALRAQLLELPPPFAEFAPGQSIPTEVEAVVFRAIAKDKSDRFESMTRMQEAIMAIPPDASASVSMPVPPYRLKPTDSHVKLASPSIRTTTSYSSQSTASTADLVSSAVSGTQPTPSSAASERSDSYADASQDSGFRTGTATVSSAKTSTGDTLKVVLAILFSLLAIAAAVAGLVWALTA